MARQAGIEAQRPKLDALATSFGYGLVDLELVKEGPGRYLRIYIDKPGGITLDDCERYHRAAQPMVEAVEYDFLEVCSPGLDRPLKSQQQWEQAVGTEISVRLYRTEQGAREFVGVLSAVDSEMIELETARGKLGFARKAIALAKPVVRFEDEEGDAP